MKRLFVDKIVVLIVAAIMCLSFLPSQASDVKAFDGTYYQVWFKSENDPDGSKRADAISKLTTSSSGKFISSDGAALDKLEDTNRVVSWRHDNWPEGLIGFSITGGLESACYFDGIEQGKLYTVLKLPDSRDPSNTIDTFVSKSPVYFSIVFGRYSAPTEDITITLIFKAEGVTPLFQALASSYSANGSASAEFTRNVEEKSEYHLTAAPNPGYNFDHWEKKPAAADDSAYETDEDATSQGENATVTIAEDTDYRAHFRVVKITPYEREADLWAFHAGPDSPFGAYEGPGPDDPDYLLWEIIYNKPSDFESPVYYMDDGGPALVGGPVLMKLNILQFDGTVPPDDTTYLKTRYFDYELYMGDETSPSMSLQNGQFICDYVYPDTVTVFGIKFVVKSFPDVNTVTLKVKMKDVEGNPLVFERTYDVHLENPNKPIEKETAVAMSIEKLAVDGKYIQEPVQVIVEEGENVSQAFLRYMASKGLPMAGFVENAGSFSSDSFYISAIRDYSQPDTWLREKAYGEYSGWMYTVNNVFPDVSAGARIVNPGDVIRWQYTCANTLDEIGKDIDGGWAGSPAPTDKTMLIRKYAELKAAGTGNADDLAAALEVMKNLNATQEEIDAALLLLTGGETPVDKGALSNAIAEANALKNAATVGTAPGAYPQEAYDAFAAAIRAAQDVNGDDNATQEEVDAAVAALQAAVDAFAKAKIAVTDYSKALGDVLAFVAAHTPSPVVGSIGGEWAVLALARGGVISQSIRDNYLVNLKTELAEKGKGSVILHNAKPTENERVTLALSSLGIDASDFEGCDLITPLTDLSWVKSQGVNSTIFALIALDSKPYAVDASVREGLIAELLSKQSAVTGDWSEYFGTDITAMALQALAPYKDDPAVAASIDRALASLSNWYKSTAPGDASSETYAQIVVALSALGMDADTHAQFTKDGTSALRDLLKFAQAGGSFSHQLKDGTNGMSTEQAAYALVAYDRYMKNHKRLYDMSDVNPSPDTGPDVEPVDTVLEDLENGTGVRVTAKPGVLPSRVELWVERLTEGEHYDKAKAALKEKNVDFLLFDICLLKNNEEIKPEGKVTVSIPAPEGYDGKTARIYHIDSSGALIDMNAELKDGCFVYETDHFSLFALTKPASSANPTEPTEPSEKTKPIQPPSTGENRPAAVWMSLFGLSMLASLALVQIKKRERL